MPQKKPDVKKTGDININTTYKYTNNHKPGRKYRFLTQFTRQIAGNKTLLLELIKSENSKIKEKFK